MFKKKRSLFLILTFLIITLIGTSVFAVEIPDSLKIKKVSGRENKINELMKKDYIIGYGDGDFGFDKKIKRSEITKLIVYANGDREKSEDFQNSTPLYNDVKSTYWANGVINAGSKSPGVLNGQYIVRGYPDGSFRPENNVTYAELSKMLVSLVDLDLTKEESLNADKNWPNSWIGMAASLNIFEDIELNDVNAQTTRDDAFVMFYNALFKYEEKIEKSTKRKSKGGSSLDDKDKINDVVVNFETNGGSKIASQKIEKGKKATKPAAPTKENYKFEGWYKDSKLTEKYDFNNKVDKDITLYAKWTENEKVTVSFNSNGGSEVDSQSIYINTKATEPAAPTKIGNEFIHWYYKGAFGIEIKYDFNKPVDKDITLYAKWQETVNILDQKENFSFNNIYVTDYEKDKNINGVMQTIRLYLDKDIKFQDSLDSIKKDDYIKIVNEKGEVRYLKGKDRNKNHEKIKYQNSKINVNEDNYNNKIKSIVSIDIPIKDEIKEGERIEEIVLDGKKIMGNVEPIKKKEKIEVEKAVVFKEGQSDKTLEILFSKPISNELVKSFNEYNKRTNMRFSISGKSNTVGRPIIAVDLNEYLNRNVYFNFVTKLEYSPITLYNDKLVVKGLYEPYQYLDQLPTGEITDIDFGHLSLVGTMDFINKTGTITDGYLMVQGDKKTKDDISFSNVLINDKNIDGGDFKESEKIDNFKIETRGLNKDNYKNFLEYLEINILDENNDKVITVNKDNLVFENGELVLKDEFTLPSKEGKYTLEILMDENDKFTSIGYKANFAISKSGEIVINDILVNGKSLNGGEFVINTPIEKIEINATGIDESNIDIFKNNLEYMMIYKPGIDNTFKVEELIYDISTEKIKVILSQNPICATVAKDCTLNISLKNNDELNMKDKNFKFTTIDNTKDKFKSEEISNELKDILDSDLNIDTTE